MDFATSGWRTGRLAHVGNLELDRLTLLAFGLGPPLDEPAAETPQVGRSDPVKVRSYACVDERRLRFS